MKNITASKIGRTLGKAGFQSQRGNDWGHGFKCSQVTPKMVSVGVNFGRSRRDREALASYAATLRSAGYTVDAGTYSLIVEAA